VARNCDRIEESLDRDANGTTPVLLRRYRGKERKGMRYNKAKSKPKTWKIWGLFPNLNIIRVRNTLGFIWISLIKFVIVSCISSL
jgi:hypothetical protein